MKPIEFKESNNTLQKPEGMTDDECAPLPIYTTGDQCISCWKVTWRERISILLFGRVWLGIFSGITQPPVWIDGSKTVFEARKDVKE